MSIPIMNFFFVLITFTIFLSFVHCQFGHEEDQEMCFPFRRAPSMRPPSGQQGRPGKLGSSGPPGPKGDQGETGECGCDPNEVERLNRTIQQLQGKYETSFNWCIFFLLPRESDRGFSF